MRVIALFFSSEPTSEISERVHVQRRRPTRRRTTYACSSLLPPPLPRHPQTQHTTFSLSQSLPSPWSQGATTLIRQCLPTQRSDTITAKAADAIMAKPGQYCDGQARETLMRHARLEAIPNVPHTWRRQRGEIYEQAELARAQPTCNTYSLHFPNLIGASDGLQTGTSSPHQS